MRLKAAGLALILLIMVSQEGCLTMTAIDLTAKTHSMKLGREAAYLMLFEIVVFPVAIADALIATAICLGHVEAEKPGSAVEEK
jgi:hypothetical protein